MTASDEAVRILYVNQDALERVRFQERFASRYEVVAAASAEQALAILDRQDVQVLLADELPEDGNLELLAQVRIHHSGVIRLIGTASTDVCAVARAVNQGHVYHFFSKPWDEEELHQVVEHSLELLALKRGNEKLMGDLERSNLALERERRRGATSLRFSEQRFATLFGSVRDAVLLHELGPQGGGPGLYLDANDVALQWLEYTREELLRLRPKDTRGPLEPHMGQARVDRALHAGGSAIFERTLVSRTGRHIPVELSANAIILPDGTKAVLAIARDISERRRADQEIRKLSRAVHESPVSVVITDRTGHIEYVNPKFCQVTGYAASEALGQHTRILNSGKQPRAFYGELWETILAGREWHGEFCNKRKDGTQFWERASISPIHDADGKIAHFVAVKEDITERRRAARELRVAKEAAEAANLAKSGFLAHMSHEIRTPLNAVLGFSQLLVRDPSLTEEQRVHVDSILRAGEHLLALINDVLEMSRIEAGRSDHAPEDIELLALLRDLELLFRERATGRGLQLALALAPDLPRHVRLDGGKLRQVLVNLVGNAIKFTHQGSVSIGARVQAAPGGATAIRFEVRDTGIGIPAEEQRRIFEPFEQSQVQQRRKGGTGLGLAISSRFVRLMGGELELVSTPEQGSAFSFALPVEVLAHAQQRAGDAARRIVRVAPGEERIRILVADDRDDNRRLLSELLGRAGFLVQEVRDGAEALDAIERSPPDLVLMDLAMPVMDGYEATRRIRGGQRADLPIIAVTASAFAEQVQEAVDAGVDEVVRKPFKEQELLVAIQRALDLACLYEGDEGSIPAEQSEEEAVAILERAERAELPDSLRLRLVRDVIAGDLDVLQRSLSELSQRDADLARRLTALAEGFQFEALLAWLEGEI